MGIPQGLIIIWSGELNTIPSGWLVCNGSNNTPDLRNRFVVAAGSSFAFNTIGGFADAIVPTHNHTVTGVSSGGNHTHTGIKILNSQSFGTYAIRTNTPNAYGGQTFALTSTTTNWQNHSHSNGSINNTGVDPVNKNLPPYYSLFFIMKGGE